jgi:hypothetical protein
MMGQGGFDLTLTAGGKHRGKTRPLYLQNVSNSVNDLPWRVSTF